MFFLSSGLCLFAWIFLEPVAGFSVWSALRTWFKKTDQPNKKKKTTKQNKAKEKQHKRLIQEIVLVPIF